MDTHTTENQHIETVEQGSAAQDFWCEPVRLTQKEENGANDKPSFGCGSTCAHCGSACAHCGSNCAHCGSTCA